MANAAISSTSSFTYPIDFLNESSQAIVNKLNVLPSVLGMFPVCVSPESIASKIRIYQKISNVLKDGNIIWLAHKICLTRLKISSEKDIRQNVFKMLKKHDYTRLLTFFTEWDDDNHKAILRVIRLYNLTLLFTKYPLMIDIVKELLNLSKLQLLCTVWVNLFSPYIIKSDKDIVEIEDRADDDLVDYTQNMLSWVKAKIFNKNLDELGPLFCHRDILKFITYKDVIDTRNIELIKLYFRCQIKNFDKLHRKNAKEIANDTDYPLFHLISKNSDALVMGFFDVMEELKFDKRNAPLLYSYFYPYYAEYDVYLLEKAITSLLPRTVERLLDICPRRVYAKLWSVTRVSSPLTLAIEGCAEKLYWQIHFNRSYKIDHIILKNEQEYLDYIELIITKCPKRYYNKLFNYYHNNPSPLMAAAATGYLKLVEKVLELNPKNCTEIWKPCVEWLSPLHYAAYGGNSEVINLITKTCPNEYIDNPWSGVIYPTPFHTALLSTNPQAFEYLRTLFPIRESDKEEKTHGITLFASAVIGGALSNINAVYELYQNSDEKLRQNMLLVSSPAYSIFDIACREENILVMQQLFDLKGIDKTYLNITQLPVTPIFIHFLATTKANWTFKGVIFPGYQTLFSAKFVNRLQEHEDLDMWLAYLQVISSTKFDIILKNLGKLIEIILKWKDVEKASMAIRAIPTLAWQRLFFDSNFKFYDPLDANNKQSLSIFLQNCDPKFLKYYEIASKENLLYYALKWHDDESFLHILQICPEESWRHLFTGRIFVLLSELYTHEPTRSILLFKTIFASCPIGFRKKLWQKAGKPFGDAIFYGFDESHHLFKLGSFLLDICPDKLFKDFIISTTKVRHFSIDRRSAPWITLCTKRALSICPFLWFELGLFTNYQEYELLLKEVKESHWQKSHDICLQIIRAINLNNPTLFLSELNGIDNVGLQKKALLAGLRNSSLADAIWKDNSSILDNFLNDASAIETLLCEIGPLHTLFTYCPSYVLEEWVNTYPNFLKIAFRNIKNVLKQLNPYKQKISLHLMHPNLISLVKEDILLQRSIQTIIPRSRKIQFSETLHEFPERVEQFLFFAKDNQIEYLHYNEFKDFEKIYLGKLLDPEHIETKIKDFIKSIQATKCRKTKDELIYSLHKTINPWRDPAIVMDTIYYATRLRKKLRNHCYMTYARRAVTWEYQEFIFKIRSKYASILELIDKVDRCYISSTEDYDAKDFIDPITEDFMLLPVILPRTGSEVIRVCWTTLEDFNNSTVLHPYHNVRYPREEYKIDFVLWKRLNNFLQKKDYIKEKTISDFYYNAYKPSE